MSTLTIDTYALVSKLKEAGIPEQQAVAQIEIITKTIDAAIEQARHDYELDNLVTKRDLKELEVELRKLEVELRKDIEILRLETKRDIAESKAELIRWVVSVGVLQTVLISALVLKLAGTL